MASLISKLGFVVLVVKAEHLQHWVEAIVIVHGSPTEQASRSPLRVLLYSACPDVTIPSLRLLKNACGYLLQPCYRLATGSCYTRLKKVSR